MENSNSKLHLVTARGTVKSNRRKPHEYLIRFTVDQQGCVQVLEQVGDVLPKVYELVHMLNKAYQTLDIDVSSASAAAKYTMSKQRYPHMYKYSAYPKHDPVIQIGIIRTYRLEQRVQAKWMETEKVQSLVRFFREAEENQNLPNSLYSLARSNRQGFRVLWGGYRDRWQITVEE